MENQTLPQAEIRKPVFPFEKRDLLFFGLFAAYAILAMDFGLFGGMNAGFCLVTLLFAVLVPVYLKRADALSVFCLTASVAGSFVFLLWQDELLRFFLFCLIFALQVTALCLSGGLCKFGIGSFRFIGDAMRLVFYYPFACLGGLFRSMKTSKKKGTAAILLGVLCSLPLVMLLIVLLSSADQAFSLMMENIWSSLRRLLGAILLAAIYLPFLFSVLYGIRTGQHVPQPFVRKERKGIPATAVTAFLLMVCAVYTAYLFSQLGYLTSGFLSVRPVHFTYSEYARRGFGEMMVVCILNLCTLFPAVLFSARRENGRIPRVQKAAMVFICLFSLAMVACSFSKMHMYINIYGMTRLRLLSSFAMLLMALFFLVGLVRLFVARLPYVKILLVLLTVTSMAFAFADPDSMIARYNYSAYQAGKLSSLDVESYERLNDSAVPVLAEMLNDSDPEIARKAGYILHGRLGQYFTAEFREEFDGNGRKTVCILMEKEVFDIRSFNVSSRRAKDLLVKNLDRLNGDGIPLKIEAAK